VTANESPLTELIRGQGNAVQLLAQHAATADGRCRSCSAGGDGSGKVRAPCNIWLAANAALDRPDPQQPG
jgi:hypothetical protein